MLAAALGVLGLALQHVAVVLDRGAAARGVDDDGVDRIALLDHLGPGVDVALGHGDAGGLVAHVMDERAAAAGARRHHDVDAAARQQADGGVVDLGPQHLLRAAGEQDHARARARPRSRRCRGPRNSAAAQQPRGRQLEHGGELVEAEAAQQTSERPGEAAPAAAPCGSARGRAARAASRARTKRSLQAARAVSSMCARAMVDEVHVVDAARAGGHAGEAREAAVDVVLHLRSSPCALSSNMSFIR